MISSSRQSTWLRFLHPWKEKYRKRTIFRDLCIAIFVIAMPTSWYFLPGRPFVPGVLPIYVSPALYLTDIGWICLLAAFFVYPTREKRWLAFPREFIWALLLIPALALVTAPFSISPPLALYSGLRWLLAVAVFLLVFQLDIPIPRFLTILLTGLCLQGGIAILQAAAQRPLGLPAEMALPIENHEAAVLYMAGRAWLRSYGQTFHPNVLGGYMLAAVLLMLPWIKHRAVQAAWLLVLCGLFFSFSRSAWVAVAVILPFLLGWLIFCVPGFGRRLAPVSVAGGLGLALLLLVFSNQVTSRLALFGNLSERTSISGRGELMHIALQTILQDPLSGAGAGNFPIVMQQFQTLDQPHYVHNLFLLLAAEIGLPGGLAWMWLWLFPLFRVGSFLGQKNPWPVILTGTWLAWGLVGLWDSYPWALETGRFFTGTLLALLARSYYLAENDGN